MRSNFRRNLLVGFSASLIILIISSTASFISIRNLLESADLVNHTNEVLVELSKVNAAMIDAETGQRGFLITGEETFLDPYVDAKTRAATAFGNVQRLTIDNSTQQANLDQLEKTITDRFFFLDMSIERKRKGEAIDVPTLRKGKEAMDQLRAAIKKIGDIERDLLAKRTVSLKKFASYTIPLIVAAAVVAFMITISFYLRVRNDFIERVKLQNELQRKDEDITNRIKIIQGIADKISAGDYNIRVDDKESDSLGAVAGSLNKMAESLQFSFNLLSDKEWTQTGIAQLNDLMIGEKSVTTLTNEVIDFLANYTKSQVGAIYLAEEKELVYAAGYGYTPDKSRTRIKFGTGLAGQAVVSRKTIALTHIPNESIYISFIAGNAKPRHALTVPVYDGYDIKGAVELATLHEFSKRDIEFLDAAAPNIGIAIATAENRKRLQDLLGETQAQAEELKAQHSELENMNSELETQAEKLQTSEEELKVQQEELQQANQELEERSRLLEERNQLITERNIDIQTKAEQLQQSTKYKTEFLANMSHELRTPLNSILLLSRLLSEDQQKNLTPDQVEYARVIQSSGHGLLSLIDEILDLSKIEAGKMQLEYTPVSIKGIVNDVQSLFLPVTAEKKIEFKVNIDSDVPASIETDKLRLEQVIRNLLSNAIKFTTKGSVIMTFSMDKKQKDFVCIAVKDTGIGIPKDKQDMVFEAFQQADGSTRRKFGGTGLGLSISRELIRLLGGDISVQSEPERGSEFTIRVPLDQSIKSQPQAIQEITPVREEKPVSKKFISTVIPESVPDDRNSIIQDDPAILIIEDDRNFAKSLLEFTRKRGYKGLVAVRGDEGIELAKQFKPTGILLDIQLPVKSGWEVMEELKSDTETRHIPVHIMSSHEVKRESLLKGAVNFINKPVAFDQMQEIFGKIEYVLKHNPKKVLIVEENPKHAKALAYFLETFEVSLEIRNEVSTAIESLKNDGVDCVILDMGVPHENAYETLEAVKKTPGLENLPIIIFTGKSLSSTEEMKIKQYADSIVVKTAHSYRRILDEVSLFLHLVEKKENGASKYNKLGALTDVLRNKTVLVADDDMRNIFSMTKALEKFQMRVIAAVDGKDALQQLKKHSEIEIVLMDMMMPEMDGYESIAAIRLDPRFKNLPVIAVTAKAMVGDRVKCINAGASDYITKPVDIDQLLSLLRVWLYDKNIR